MPASFRSLKILALSMAACAAAQASDWVPSSKQGAQITNVYLGLDDEPDPSGYRSTVLKVTLQGAGRFRSTYLDVPVYTSLYQSLVQAEADHLPVILLADTASRVFEAVLIGTVDPEFPLALGGAAVRKGTQGKAVMGYDPLGRARFLAEAARVPLLIRPAKGNARRPER
jgi:hypothetical protein